jgi:Zn-dependent peptidase ImmA (M78 family)
MNRSPCDEQMRRGPVTTAAAGYGKETQKERGSSRHIRSSSANAPLPIHVEMAGIDTNRGAKRAREARAALGLDPGAPLECLLTVVEDRVGVPVIVRAMPENVAGCLWHREGHRLIHVNGTHPLARQRFTLAHELGHVRCGHDGALAVDEVGTITGRTVDPAERQANAFAAEFLVPKVALQRLVTAEPTLDALVELAARFGVSTHVALFRCITCGLVGEARAARLREEIDAGHHLERHAAIAPPEVDDRLARIVELPYLSPALAGSAPAAALGGHASVDQVAHAAGVDPGTLMPAVVALSGSGAEAR